MLAYLFEYLDSIFELPGASLFQYISFRTFCAVSLSTLLTIFYGKKYIRWMEKLQMKEKIRDLGLDGQKEKEGKPTMGGVLVIFSTLVSVLLFVKLISFYIFLLVITLIWMGFIGFIDDYYKIRMNSKKGLKGKYKIYGQVILGIFIATYLYFSDDFTTYQFPDYVNTKNIESILVTKDYQVVKSLKTTIPFLKGNELDYENLLPDWLSFSSSSWILFTCIIVFIVTAVSNGANLTDGMDGLLPGTSIIIFFTLGVLAYVSGNVIFSTYLNIMYIPNLGEVVVFIGAIIGAMIGFFWYNTHPANIFLGDTGSLSIGATISVIAILVKKELLLPFICGIFLVENVSVILQVFFFKYTKKRFGVGKRIFKMAPLHHHYQKMNIHESKIVNRFLIIAVLLSIFSIVTLKIR